MSNPNEPITFTQEEIEYAERRLKAEFQKLERAIERKKKELEELKPKGFLGGLKENKDKVKEAEAQLAKLEDDLIDLNVMSPKDFLNHLKEKRVIQEQFQKPQTKIEKTKRKRRDDDDWEDEDFETEFKEMLSDSKSLMGVAKSELKGMLKDNIPSGKDLFSILDSFF